MSDCIPSSKGRAELLRLLQTRERLHDEFRLAEQKRGSFECNTEMTAFDSAHDKVVDWVNENASELLPMLTERAPPEPPAALRQIAERIRDTACADDAPADSLLVKRELIGQLAQMLRGSVAEPPADSHAYATKDDLFNAGATQARYRYRYRDALMKISEGPPGTLPNDEVAAWAGQIASEALDDDSPALTKDASDGG